MSSSALPTRALILSRPVVVAILAIGFALIFVTGLLTAFSTRGIAAANQRTAETQHALVAGTQFLSALAEALTLAHAPRPQDADALRLRTHRERARAELATLRNHFEPQPALRPVLEHLDQLVTAYFHQLESTPRASAAAQPLAGEIQQIVATLQRNQFLALAQRSASAAHRAETVQMLNLALIAIGGSLAVAVCLWLLRRVRELEGLITVCAWTRRVQWEGKWLSFEEYLAKRFNLFCTHGICEEAAEKMRQEAANTPVPADFSR